MEKHGPEKTPYLDTFHAVSGFLLKNTTETIKNVAKEQKRRISQYVITLGASLLGNLLTGKCTIRAGEGTVWWS